MTAHTDEICRHRWMALCRGMNGEPFIRETDGGVFIVPVNDRDEVRFTIEPAVTDGTPVLCLPAGAIEPGEDPVNAVNRELQEEAGYRAGRWTGLRNCVHWRAMATGVSMRFWPATLFQEN